MFKHILVPTDGSELSQAAAQKAVQFAKAIGARITVITVTAPWSSIAVGEVASVLSEKDYENRAETNAWGYLNTITDAAKAAGVPRNAIHLHHIRPDEAIIETAKKEHCDLIMLGSHGRRGVSRMLLGSEATKILSHSPVPVMVLREPGLE